MYAEERELIKIAQFCSATSEFIKDVVKGILETAGGEVTEQSKGLNLCYDIQYEGKKACLFFRNLYLEIATKDRDAEPLEFDEKLSDFDYFLVKTKNVIYLKLKMLLELLKSDDIDKTIENILRDFDRGRIFIRKPSKSESS